MPIEEHHRDIATAYDIQLNPSWLTPSPNGCGEAGQNLDTEMLSLMLTSLKLQDEVLRSISIQIRLRFLTGSELIQADLEAIDFDGVLRRSADRLKKVIDDSAAAPELRRRAEDALVELYVRIVGGAREEAA